MAKHSDRSLAITYRSTGDIKADPRNARTHPDAQVAQLAASMRSFGFTNPVLIDEGGTLIAGHGRMLAARAIGLTRVPTITLAGLSGAQARALRLADNKIATGAGWDLEILTLELAELAVLDIDLDLTGFAADEIAVVIGGAAGGAGGAPSTSLGACAGPATSLGTNGRGALGTNKREGDGRAGVEAPALRSRPGDIWQLGAHRIGCGDARDRGFLAALVGGDAIGCVVLNLPRAGATAANDAAGDAIAIGRIAEALFGATESGSIVLDPAIGTGASLIAAERTGRRLRGCDGDAAAVDAALRGWSFETGLRYAAAPLLSPSSG